MICNYRPMQLWRLIYKYHKLQKDSVYQCHSEQLWKHFPIGSEWYQAFLNLFVSYWKLFSLYYLHDSMANSHVGIWHVYSLHCYYWLITLWWITLFDFAIVHHVAINSMVMEWVQISFEPHNVYFPFFINTFCNAVQRVEMHV